MTNFEMIIKDKEFNTLIERNRISCAIFEKRNGHNCCNGYCTYCEKESFEWLQQEYEPPKLKNGDDLKVGDWIMVKDDVQDGWIKRQFCYFYKDHFYCAQCESDLEEQKITCIGWIYARLPEEGE